MPDSDGPANVHEGGVDTGMDSRVPDTAVPTDATTGADVFNSGGDATEADANDVEEGADASETGPEPPDSAADTSPQDTSVADTSGGEGGDASAVDAAASDASDGGVDSADAAVCNTMWPVGGTNSVANPDFESAMDAGGGWSARFGGGTFSVSSTTAHCGTHSGEIVGRTQPYQALATLVSNTAGANTVALWVLHDAMKALQLSIQGYGICGDAGGQFFNLDSGGGFPVVVQNTWTFVSGTLTVPANCTSMNLVISQDTAQGLAAPFPDIFVDDVFVGH
jgi:hypothetical protein